MNGSSERFESVFVVIDPECMLQPALIKGEWIAARDGARLTVYCCVYDEALDQDAARQGRELDQIRSWLKRLVAPAEGYGLDAQGLRIEAQAPLVLFAEQKRCPMLQVNLVIGRHILVGDV